ncbi:MAG: acireductone synthase [Saprospiraceae bacterium]|nr:acireductone synthase [Saprospiraceae bacterium]
MEFWSDATFNLPLLHHSNFPRFQYSMIHYILTDIEGTTTDIAFVQKVLFPYSYQKLPDFVRTNASEAAVAECIKEAEQTLNTENQLHTNLEQVIEALLFWIKEDRKHPALKKLQGMIWREGYETKGFKGHVYPDVLPQLENWRAQDIGIGIYSSGSVEAQKLLFGYSEYGDLNHLFDHNFDTRVGHKRETESYQNIAKALNLNSEQILFLSDIEAELDAAQEAGMQTIQLVREGTTASERHKTASDFSEIKIKD